MKLKQIGISTLGIILLILLLMLVIGAFPIWPHAASWGYAPSSLFLVILVVLIVLIATGRM